MLYFNSIWNCFYKLTWYLVSNSAVTKNPLRFDNLLGGLTELRKAALCVIMASCGERTEIKSSKGRKLTGWRRERPVQASSCLLPVDSHRQRCIAQRWCVTVESRHWQPGKLTEASVPRPRAGGQSPRHAAPVWLTPAKRGSDSEWLRTTGTHLSINCLAWRTIRITKTHLPGTIFLELSWASPACWINWLFHAHLPLGRIHMGSQRHVTIPWARQLSTEGNGLRS